MNLNVYRTNEKAILIEEYFELYFDKDSIPFKTKIIPVALPSVTYIEKGEHIVTSYLDKFYLKNIVLSGQSLKAYDLEVNEESRSFGFNLHPTALYKIFNSDISKLEDKHTCLKGFCNDTFLFLENIFASNSNSDNAINEAEKRLQSLPLTINIHTKNIDRAIAFIREKNGLLNVTDLLCEISISQKTLETKFKKIVGTTPGKYIKLYRFIKLMQKYESQEIELKELIHMYDYYDESHFAKDFKIFMRMPLKQYFNKEHEMLKKYLK